jgi:hypothetical protein
MKNKTLPIALLLIVVTVTSCKKQNQQPKLVISTWQQVSQRLYMVYPINPQLNYDTTFRPNFTSGDNIKIYDDGTCIISSNFQFFPPSPYYPQNPKYTPGGQDEMDWTGLDNAYVFTPLPYNGPPSPTFLPPWHDTAFIVHGDSLRYVSVSPMSTATIKLGTVAIYVKK